MKKGKFLWCCLAVMLLCGCGLGAGSQGLLGHNSEALVERQEGQCALAAGLEQVSDCFSADDYDERPSLKAEVSDVYQSADGLCVIKRMEPYFDVTLDFEKGSHAAVGKAYGECLHSIDGLDHSALERYIFENIHMAYPDLAEDYSPVWTRAQNLLENMPKEYVEELDGLAQGFSGGIHGIKEDGIMSYEEACIGSMVPDILRGMECFGLSVWGNQTKQGERYTARVLEWNLGSENQMAKMHAVVHVKNGEKSYTAVGQLGIIDILTAFSDDGVMVGILDVRNDREFKSEGRIAYTWAIRYAIENYDTADEVAEFLLSHQGEYTYNPNILVGDQDHSYCVELCNETDKWPAVLRDEHTPLLGNVTWEVPDSLCIVNEYVATGNGNNMQNTPGNYGRWRRMEQWLQEEKQMDLAAFKEVLTRDNLRKSDIEGQGDYAMNVVSVFNDYMVHIAIMDYSTGDIHVAFVGEDKKQNRPDFYVVGNYHNQQIP